MKIPITWLLLFSAPNCFAQSNPVNYPVSKTKATQIVAAVLKTSPVIDGHNDLFIKYMDCKSCPRDLKDYRIDSMNKGHTDIPKLRKGGAGAVLMNVFGNDSSLLSYHKAWDLLYRMEQAYQRDIKIAGSAAEMRTAMKEGRIAFLPILEGAVRLKDDPALLRTYYKLGLRSVTFAYKTNGLADGSDDSAKHNGISAIGRDMIKEMNRLGVLIDMSHISAKAMNDILDVTQSPVIFSHSNVKALCNVNRNVPDDVLIRLKQNRGIIMLTFVPYFVKNEHTLWLDAGDTVYYKAKAEYPGQKEKVDSIMEKWEGENEEPVVTVADMANHFDYVKKLIGVDYIGMAGDFDGIQFTIRGLENAGTYPNLLTELARRGWTVAELKKITSENFLRVFEDVEKKAALLREN
ncbi:MAG: dipeptidase [Chitinophagaceae bacterium]|nr:dipeptidase [Chitinophagaceae bacterium]